MGRHAGNTNMQAVFDFVSENKGAMAEQIAAGTGLRSKDVSGVLYRLKLQGLLQSIDRRWSAIDADAPRQVITQSWPAPTIAGHWLDFAICAPARQLQGEIA